MKMGSRVGELGDGSLAERVALETGWLDDVLANASELFPNLQQVYLSSRIYAGYESNPNHAETQTGYDNGFAVKAIVAEAVAGSTSVWGAWGPYLWADGETPRNDGLTWECSDFESDGVHPSAPGEAKVAGLLVDFFTSEPVACAWFLATGCGAAGGPFQDVPTTDVFFDDIAWLAAEGITKGCNPPAGDMFCPDDTVTRGQMVAFLHRSEPWLP